MSATLERLRRLRKLQNQGQELTYEALPPEPDAFLGGVLEELVPGQEIHNPGGDCYVTETAFSLATVRGGRPLAAALRAPLDYLHTGPGLADFDLAQAVFLDTETTGLGGAGVYAFMVGVGRFERRSADGDPLPLAPDPTHFVVRQYFMRHPGEEPAQLVAVAADLAQCRGLVTFNGRTFDAPLLRNRFHQNQIFHPHLDLSPALLQPDAPHLDLLHPARRLWRLRLQSVALSNLELHILSLARSQEDVPGALIPALYINYLRTGEVGEMARVFYHNREDIVSMVFLAERMGRAFADPFGPQQQTELMGQDYLSLGHLYEAQADMTTAERAFRRAVAGLAGRPDQKEALHRLALLYKRQERWEEACAIWQEWISSVPGIDPTPYVELAKYWEWQAQDLEQAQMWTGWALHTQRSAPPRRQDPQHIAELEHRLARLQRKLTSSSDQ